MNNQPSSLKFAALEAAVYCPNHGDDKPIDSVELLEFDVEKIKDHVKNSVPLLSYNKSHRPIIVEILDVLDQYRSEFLVDQHKYICFYWSGILVYKVVVKKSSEATHDKELHVSLQKYKTERDNLVWNRKFMFSMVIASVAIFGVSLAKYYKGN